MSTYIIAHKPYNKVIKQGYTTLQVGAFKGHTIGDVYDDTGENISERNPQFCELTGLYWLWKNCDDDYIGMCHYRRFFSTDFFGKNPVSEKKILQILKNRKVIVPFHRTLEVSVAKQYCRNSGFEKDLQIVGEIIKEKHPEYFDTYNNVLNGNKAYFYNMIIARRDVFRDYCEWLFDILFEAEKRIDITGYNDYQKRIYGFLSERLLMVWLQKNNINPFEMGVINTEEKWSLKKRLLTGLKRSLLSLRG